MSGSDCTMAASTTAMSAALISLPIIGFLLCPGSGGWAARRFRETGPTAIDDMIEAVVSEKEELKVAGTPADVIKQVRDAVVKMVDFRFVDLPGVWQRFSSPASEVERLHGIGSGTIIPRIRG